MLVLCIAMGEVEHKVGHVALKLEHIVAGALALAEGCLSFVILLVTFHTLLAIVMLLGGTMVVLRRLFFWMIPALIEWADPIVLVINFQIRLLNAFCDAAIGIFDIIAITDDIFGGSMQAVPPMVWGTLTVSEYKHALKTIATTCVPYTDIWSTWQRAVMPEISPFVCPYARAIYPVTGDVAHRFEGFVTTDPDPYGNNCDVDRVPPYAGVCVGLSAGYVILELLLPLMLLFFFLNAAGGPLKTVLWSATTLVLYLVTNLTEYTLEFADTAGNFLIGLTK